MENNSLKESWYSKLSIAVNTADNALEQIELLFATMQASSTQAWIVLKPFDFSLKSARALCGLLKKESAGIIDIVLGVTGTALHGARACGYTGAPLANTTLKLAAAGKQFYNRAGYTNTALSVASGVSGLKPFLSSTLGKGINKFDVYSRAGAALARQSRMMGHNKTRYKSRSGSRSRSKSKNNNMYLP